MISFLHISTLFVLFCFIFRLKNQLCLRPGFLIHHAVPMCVHVPISTWAYAIHGSSENCGWISGTETWNEETDNKVFEELSLEWVSTAGTPNRKHDVQGILHGYWRHLQHFAESYYLDLVALKPQLCKQCERVCASCVWGHACIRSVRVGIQWTAYWAHSVERSLQRAFK